MSDLGNVFAATVIAGSVGWIVGHWQGAGSEREFSRQMFMHADLPAFCEDRLRDAVDSINAAGEARQIDQR